MRAVRCAGRVASGWSASRRAEWAPFVLSAAPSAADRRTGDGDRPDAGGPGDRPRPAHLTARMNNRLVVLLEIHAGVQGGHVVPIAVEWQRRPPTELADATLGGLAPPRMIDGRIDVRVEAVLG